MFRTDQLLKLTAVGGMMAASSAAVAVPVTYTFGSDNGGLEGFTANPSPDTATQTFTTLPGSVQYRSEDTGTVNSSLLRDITIDRSSGNAYTFEGVLIMADGYADDNNRLGIYLFGDAVTATDENEAGALGIIFNYDDGVASGGDTNDDDQIEILEGFNNSVITQTTRDQSSVPDVTNLFGTQVTLAADVVFDTRLFDDDNDALTPDVLTDVIDVTARLTAAGDVTTTDTATVVAADFTGDFFGFVTRSRARNFGTVGDPRSNPSVLEYESFSVTVVPEPASLALIGLGGALMLGRRRHS